MRRRTGIGKRQFCSVDWPAERFRKDCRAGSRQKASAIRSFGKSSLFVVRLQSPEQGPNYRAFEARGGAVARFLGGRIKVIDGHLLEAAIYDVRTKDARTAIEMVRVGKAALIEIYPEPMTAHAG